MEDYEVRQALAIIKDRVNEIKQDVDWKQKIADEWNEAADLEKQNNVAVAKQPAKKNESDARSQISYRSNATGVSKAPSYQSRVKEALDEERASKPDWNGSVTSSKRQDLTAEDKIASRIANEVLKENTKLRGVHSAQSIK